MAGMSPTANLYGNPNTAKYMPGIAPTDPTSSFGNPATFTAAAQTQAADYDKIMAQYADLAKSLTANPLTSSNVTPQTVTPTTAPYTQSSDVTGSLSDLSNLATTGGYTDQGIADLRARGIAPIRSIYSSAQQGLERQKALQGGYSPNYGAVSAKMARDMSEEISGAETNVNATIAQNVAQNKLSAAPAYASASSTANAQETAANQANAAIVNQINEANANANLTAQTGNADRAITAGVANRTGVLGAIQGQASLYGTTPALTNTFGNQVVQAAQLGQGQQNLNQQSQRAALALG